MGHVEEPQQTLRLSYGYTNALPRSTTNADILNLAAATIKRRNKQIVKHTHTHRGGIKKKGAGRIHVYAYETEGFCGLSDYLIQADDMWTMTDVQAISTGAAARASDQAPFTPECTSCHDHWHVLLCGWPIGDCVSICSQPSP